MPILNGKGKTMKLKFILTSILLITASTGATFYYNSQKQFVPPEIEPLIAMAIERTEDVGGTSHAILISDISFGSVTVRDFSSPYMNKVVFSKNNRTVSATFPVTKIDDPPVMIMLGMVFGNSPVVGGKINGISNAIKKPGTSDCDGIEWSSSFDDELITITASR
jgi:hypothetical protein